MLFSSYEFIFIFLPFVALFYFLLNKYRLLIAAKSFLVFASLFFYSWWNPVYLPLILVSLIFNYSVGASLSSTKKTVGVNRKCLLVFGVVVNVIVLAYFKYVDFFIENINILISSSIQSQNIILPLAISFFTFQQIAYLVDSYKRETEEYNILNYTLFVTFFPQLIAGPIVHHREMMPQFASLRLMFVNYKNVTLGFFIFAVGLFKKVVIADSLSSTVSAGFDQSLSLNFFEAWLTSFSYTFQLYFDFSGYSDMAIGIALIFNIKLPLNFNSPYKSLSIQDFWRRWHITLSSFLRDYIYIPLGGNRGSEISTYVNVFLTFLIGGLWHGASWMFILWGALHGLALIVHRAWISFGGKMPNLVAWFITFNFVNVTWIFFRAETMQDATKVLSGMFGFNGIVLPNAFSNNFGFLHKHGILFGSWLSSINGKFELLMLIVLSFVICLGFNNASVLRSRNCLSYIDCVKYGLVFSVGILVMLSTKPGEFLYFNF